jgi:hypothetical protein
MTSHTSGSICMRLSCQHVAPTHDCKKTVNWCLNMPSPPPKVLLFDIGGVCVSYLPFQPSLHYDTDNFTSRSYPPSQPSSITKRKTRSPSAGSTPQSPPLAKPAHGQNSNAAKYPSTPPSSPPSPRTSATKSYGETSTSNTSKRRKMSRQHKQQRKLLFKSHHHLVLMGKSCIGT